LNWIEYWPDTIIKWTIRWIEGSVGCDGLRVVDSEPVLYLSRIPADFPNFNFSLFAVHKRFYVLKHIRDGCGVWCYNHRGGHISSIFRKPITWRMGQRLKVSWDSNKKPSWAGDRGVWWRYLRQISTKRRKYGNCWEYPCYLRADRNDKNHLRVTCTEFL